MDHMYLPGVTAVLLVGSPVLALGGMLAIVLAVCA